MDAYLSIIESGDLCSLGFVILLLAAVGGRMVNKSPRLRVLGWQLSAGAFVFYGAYAVILTRTTDTGELAMILVRATLAAGFMLGLAWVLLPVIAFLVKAPALALRNWRIYGRQRLADQRDSERSEAAHRDRELARQQEAAKAQVDAQAQKRRAAARAQCEFLYHLHSPEIEPRFPRSKFDDFVGKFLSDRQSAEDVETHAEQLRVLIDAHMKKADPGPRLKTLQELDDWYRDQKSQIDALPDGSLKGSLYAMLEASRAEFSFRVMEELSP
jgi:hypothetical protein